MLNDSFYYQSETLWCDGVPVNTIADAVGTPVYVYSTTRLIGNVSHLQHAFEPLSPSIHFSIKANGNLALLRRLNSAGLGMDAVSAGEIYRALQAGVNPAHIVFAGVGKTRAEIAYALEVGIGWFNVESPAELRLLNTLAGSMGQMPTVALRLNPGIQAQTHHHIATGHFGAKFGMTPDVIRDLLARRAEFPHLYIAGLHIHIGSQLGDVRETVASVKTAQALADPYPDIRTLNIGGGFPVNYTESDEFPPLEAFVTALAPELNGWHLMIEPGRSIVADAGVLIVSVLYAKEQGDQRFVITDGSMTELIRPALYEAVHPVIPVHVSDKDTTLTIVAGPVCESSDVLHRGERLPPLHESDRLAVMVTGAYGMVMASNYNMRTRPPEVLVDDDSWHVIRRRETWQDLLRLEEPPE